MKEIIVFYHDHLDPQWSRCYTRPAFDGDIQLRSYSDVWDWVLESWLEMADEGYPYSEGQTLVWRTYLARRPERLARLQELIRKGVLQIPLQGEMTVETNYSPAEALTRNFLLARPMYEQLCGLNHEGLGIAWIWDGFGQSASYPQLLRLAGANVVGGNKYRPCMQKYWKAIDGTKLPCFDLCLSNIYYVCSKHPHCPQCAGVGCEACGGRGMVKGREFEYEEILSVLERAAREPEKMSFVYIGGEEVLPDRKLLDSVAEMNRRYTGSAVFRFGQLSDLWAREQETFREIADSYEGTVGDLNPVHQGCYVTRIENKQRTHAVAAALVRAEATLADHLYREGKQAETNDELDRAWRNVLLNMHHDSISGAHIDSGQSELMGLLDDAEQIAWRHGGFLPPRIPVDDNFREVRGQAVKRLGNIDITFDKKGIISATVDGCDPFGSYYYKNISFYHNDSPRLHVGELVLQCEWGDNHNAYTQGDKVALGSHHLGVWESKDAIRWQGRHNTGDPLVKKLAWTTTVRASEDGKRLDFIVEVDWDTYNKRLRVAIPVNSTEKNALWGIPFGHVERSFDPDNIEPLDTTSIKLAARPLGDFPAHHWAWRSCRQGGVALLTRGLPSVRWTPGCFELSLLRSPQMTGDTVVPSLHEFWDVDGTRDTGRHRLEFSVWPGKSMLAAGEIARQAYAYNGASPQLPFRLEGDVIVTAWKPAAYGEGNILRLYEAEGDVGHVRLSFDRIRRVQPVDLMERPLAEAEEADTYDFPLHRHQVLTLRIE